MSFSICEIFRASARTVMKTKRWALLILSVLCSSQWKAPHLYTRGIVGHYTRPAFYWSKFPAVRNNFVRQNVSFVPSTRGNTILFSSNSTFTNSIQIVKSTVFFTSHIASIVKLNDNLSWVTELAVQTSRSLQAIMVTWALQKYTPWPRTIFMSFRLRWKVMIYDFC